MEPLLTFTNKTALVVAPHPDDEVLGCGATVARLSREGWDIHVTILTEGSTVQYPGDTEVAERKQREAKAAAKCLGTQEPQFFNLPDMGLHTTSAGKLESRLLALVEERQPSIIFAPWRSDLNTDHARASIAARVAARPDAHSPSRVLLEYETPSSTEHAIRGFEPNTWIPVSSEDLNAKCAALDYYESETRDSPHGRSAQSVCALASHRGHQTGSPWAEAFSVARWYLEKPL